MHLSATRTTTTRIHAKFVAGVEDGYPRFHVIMKDPHTGRTFEWQVGTRVTTTLFEQPGIDIGTSTLKKGMKPNIHDIEYDIFKAVQDTNQALATNLGIPVFRRDVAKAAARTGREQLTDSELQHLLSDFHKRASKILHSLIEEKGTDYVEEFFH